MAVITEATTTPVPKQNKIKNIFKRDEKTNLLKSEFSKQYFNFIDWWTITEKIDGMNMRIHANQNGEFLIGGKTDKANIPQDLVDNIGKLFPGNSDEEFNEFIINKLDDFGYAGYNVTLFGEGYGAGIQKGGIYREDKSFILYDVCFTKDDGRKFFAPPREVEDIAESLGIECVRMIHGASLEYVMLFCESVAEPQLAELHSYVDLAKMVDEYSEYTPEGFVVYPTEPLYDSFGERIVFKLKTKDIVRLREYGVANLSEDLNKRIRETVEAYVEALAGGDADTENTDDVILH